jgi:hypothetical protein
MALHARDTRTRETLAIVARDEQAHADLAADVLQFCLATGGKPIRDALASSIETSRIFEVNGLSGTSESNEGADVDERRRFGCADAATSRLAREEALESSLQFVDC